MKLTLKHVAHIAGHVNQWELSREDGTGFKLVGPREEAEAVVQAVNEVAAGRDSQGATAPLHQQLIDALTNLIAVHDDKRPEDFGDVWSEARAVLARAKGEG